MRTFLRVSLVGNAFIDLACILFLLHSKANNIPNAAFSPERAQERVAVDSSNPIGVFAEGASFVPGELPGSYPIGLPAGNVVPAKLVPFGGIPTYTTAYDVGRLRWRFEDVPFTLRLGEGAYSRPSP